ncbi:MAG TPA: Gfo/Idh/MocA family oxidoreductase [Planctomycetota bacterium]|jgi:predicted dehydrogenase|nr:Gfo/Idh/MocA family oxidoreductase [Planctomycetota bacterium]
MAKTNASTNNGGLSRREFLGSATLTTAGVVTGLTFYYTHPRPPELSAYDIEANQVRMGYIGIGNRGGSLMRSSFQVPGCIPIAVADIRETQREAFLTDMQKPEDQGCRAKKPASWKVQAYDDYRQLLDRKDIEAVTIATPHYLHAPMAIEALEAGKHVYCEKAMAYTIGENQDLAALAASKPNQIFQVGHQRRYSPIYRRVKELIDEGAIGDVVAIRAQWNQNNIERRPCPDPALEKVINWRLYSEFSGGLATEFACHQVDVANWMIGTHPDAVCGFGGVDWYRDGRDTTDNIHLVFNYKVPAKVDASGAAQEPRNVKLTYTSLMQNSHVGPSELILGTKGTIEVCLSGGGEYFVEPSAEAELEALRRAKEGKPPLKKAVKAGATIVASCLKRKAGKAIDVPENRRHWTKFTKPLEGAYDTGETFIAVGGFLDAVRAQRAGDAKKAREILRADVQVGLEGAVPCLLANMALREQRTVYWSEFFNGEKA